MTVNDSYANYLFGVAGLDLDLSAMLLLTSLTLKFSSL